MHRYPIPGDRSLTVDTAYRIYNWDGGFTPSSRNEINGRGRSMRHYDRPLTIFRGGVDYTINRHHSFSLNYLLNRTGNNRRDDIDETFEPTNDVLTKHILGLTLQPVVFRRKMGGVRYLSRIISTQHLSSRMIFHG